MSQLHSVSKSSVASQGAVIFVRGLGGNAEIALLRGMTK
jgi:hypothetical protein